VGKVPVKGNVRVAEEIGEKAVRMEKERRNGNRLVSALFRD
jgi:hypothetical protein